MRKEQVLPQITFKTRVRDDSIEGDNPYRWEDKTTADYFLGKRVILFGVPGAFTPTCSSKQLPDYEKMYPKFKDRGIDEIYCISVNDAFVMNAWAKQQNLENVKVIPDGSALFTKAILMDCRKDNLGFGIRSWRYSVIINDGVVEMAFPEASQRHDSEEDPYEISTPQNVMMYIKSRGKNGEIL